jgi:LysM repeat protein
MANERLLYKALENTVVVQADSAQKIISDIKEEVSQVPTEKKQVSYTVQKGDYISLIARKFQVKVSEIMEWNNLKSETLFIGQKLTIFSNETVVQTPPPVAPKPTPVSTSQYKYYTVRSGDTLYGIALKYKVTVAEIMKWNNLRSKTINVGQKIKIKTG